MAISAIYEYIVNVDVACLAEPEAIYILILKGLHSIYPSYYVLFLFKDRRKGWERKKGMKDIGMRDGNYN